MTVADEDPELRDEYNCVISDVSIPNGEENNKIYDKKKENSYVSMELGLPIKDDYGLMRAIVKRHKLDDEGKNIRNLNYNPLLDTIVYEVEFSDGTTEVITASIIANNMLVQVDEEVHCQMLSDDIIEHRQDVNSILKEDVFTKTTNGVKRRKRTTSGWQ